MCVWDEAGLSRQCEGGKRNKQFLNGATMVPPHIWRIESLCSQFLAKCEVAGPIDVVDCGCG